MQDDIISMIQSTLSIEGAIGLKLIESLAIVLVLWLLRYIIIWVVNLETDDIRARYWWKKATSYMIGLLGLLLIGPIWMDGIRSIATFLGLVSAGFAIALQGPITDLAGWLFILVRGPFHMGDRVQIGDHAGDVVDIRMFQFTLLEIGNWVAADQSTGRIMHVPNRKIFSDALANYSQGFEYIWHEIPVTITFESDWIKAKTILLEIANDRAGNISQTVARQVREASRRYMITYSKLTPIVYTGVQGHGVMLTVRYLCQVRRRRSSEQEIWEDILIRFAQHPDINFAYPTQRYYHNWLEGSPNQKMTDEGTTDSISIEQMD